MVKKSQVDYSHLCGWVDPKDRTDEQHEADALARNRMPKFAMYGSTGEPLPDKVILTQLWDSEEVQAALGFKFPGFHQLSGSCVGVGYGDTAFSTLVSEVIVAKQPHKIIVPFWPLTYGRGRARAGMRGRGEGSFGTAQADAARLDGCIDFAEPGLPGYKESEGLVIAKSEELNWSDGNAIDKKWLEMAKHNIIGTTSVQDTVDGVKVGLQNYYAHTLATSMYCNPGNAKIKEGVTLGQFDTNGGHQTSLQAYMLHPVLGDIFYNKNQWGNVYPLDPITGRRDGCWITKSSLQWAVSQREVIAYSGQTGFAARTWKWIWQ